MSATRRAAALSAADAISTANETDDLVFLDVHFRHVEHDCEEIYLSGHVPGAHFFPLQHYTDHPAGLPPIDLFQREVRRWGVEATDHVIVYSGKSWRSATRAWWLLKWAGIADVSFLSGGIGAWVANGGPLEIGSVDDGAGTITLWPGGLPAVTGGELAELAERAEHTDDTVLLDARDARAFRGASGAPALSGAVNAPAVLNLDEGELLPPDELRRYYGRLGIDESTRVVVYSETGFSASLTVLALSTIGVRAALHPGRLADVHAPVDA